jgi:hypothetical protein
MARIPSQQTLYIPDMCCLTPIIKVVAVRGPSVEDERQIVLGREKHRLPQ